MTDPHLHSIHLPAPRRALFRQARAGLLVVRPTPPAQASDTTANASGWVLMDRGQAHPLRAGLNTLGRFTDNHVVVGDPMVSRRHCAIVVRPDLHCEVHDTASRNGTYVNGERVTAPTALRSGDALELGCCRLVLIRADDPGDAPTYCGID